MNKVMDGVLTAKDGLKAGIPIAVGYIPACMAFGLISKTLGIPLIYSTLFSGLVFAGASQFMALNLLSLGVSAWEIIIATALLNSRYLLLSASVAAKMKKERKLWLSIIAFGITDEIFSVATMEEGKLSIGFMLTLEGIVYGVSLISTIAGYIIGTALPTVIQGSMGIALYAMFVAILIPQIKKCKMMATLVVGAGIINVLLSYLNLLSSGVNIIIASVVVAGLSTILINDDKKEM